MENSSVRIDLLKMVKYILKHIWFALLLAGIAFGFLYVSETKKVNTYSASGTMYVFNGNPNMMNYQYTNSSDLITAVQLIDTYLVVVRSNKVMDVVTERLSANYPGIAPEFIASTLSMASVSETGVVRVRAVTRDPQLSADIVNAVLDVAPEEIIRVVNAGGIEIIDYATAPLYPDYRSPVKQGMVGGLIGGAAGCAILALLFLLNGKIRDTRDLTDHYTPPVLSVILRSRKKSSDPGSYLLQEGSSLDVVESYAKLRMNLLYTMIEKESNVVVISSAVPGEGKSTISANLAISTSWSGKKVLLIDGDMRRAAQREIFGYDKHVKGLSEVLLGSHNWKEVIQRNVRGSLDLLAAGTFPPNPTDLLGSERMKAILAEMSKEYEMIIIDTPPVNIVSDSLTLSKSAAGCLFIVRQNFSDHKYIRKALISMEMTDMDVLGFVFYGEKISDGNFHQRRKYKSYYSKYDNRKNLNTQSNAVKQEPQGSAEKQKNTEKQKPQDTDKQKTVR